LIQFLYFRIAFGLYLSFENLRLIPYSNELFGNHSVAPMGLLPLRPSLRIEAMGDWPGAVYGGVLLVGAIGGVLFSFGWHRRAMALLLFLCQWIVMHRLPLADNPETYLLQWTLLATVLVPPRERWAGVAQGSFAYPKGWQQMVWLVFTSCYFFAATMKLTEGDLAWRDGSALFYLFHESPPRRLWYGDAMLYVSNWMWPILTWSALALHFLGLPLCFHRLWRRCWWWAMLSAQITSLILLDLGSIIVGMMLVQFLCWNPWVKETSTTSGLV
jgi:hypothetical protein